LPKKAFILLARIYSLHKILSKTEKKKQKKEKRKYSSRAGKDGNARLGLVISGWTCLHLLSSLVLLAHKRMWFINGI
jgi:hypothetical protein